MLDFEEVWQCLSTILTRGISFLNFDFEVFMSESVFLQFWSID